MRPVIFTIPFIGWDVPGYGLMLMSGFLLSIYWATQRASKSGANPDVILNCGFIALIAGVVGCRIMYVVHYWDQFKIQGSTFNIILAVVNITRGGLEFYGGFMLSVVLVLAWLKWYEKVSLRWYMDIVAPSAALGLAIGRIGCFLNGCCYGGVCDLPWAVSFPYGSPAQMEQWREKAPGAELPEPLLLNSPKTSFVWTLTRESIAADDQEIAKAERQFQEYRSSLKGVEEQLAAATDPQEQGRLRAEKQRLGNLLARGEPHADIRNNMRKYNLTAAQIRELAASHRSLGVHPTQLYSMITAGLVALLLNALYWRRTRDGQVILTLLLIEPVTRWILEVIRTDNPVDTLGLFTVSQGLALAMTLIGLFGLIGLRALPPRSPHAQVWVAPEG